MSDTKILSKKRISNGVYEGVYKGKKGQIEDPIIELVHMGQKVSEITASKLEGESDTWIVKCTIPTEAISDGIQTFLLCKEGEEAILDSFSIAAGEPLEDDLINEISLLREELDMLKRAFRRHCVETVG